MEPNLPQILKVLIYREAVSLLYFKWDTDDFTTRTHPF